MTHRRFVAAVLAVALAVFAAPLLASDAKPQPAGKVNINTASAAQLEALPGIGPSLAARIVEYRTKSGSFRSPQELMNVKGIGEKSFAKLEAYLTVGDAPKVQATK
jgi:competence protein ComEA